MKQNKWTLGINGILLLTLAACSADAPLEKVQTDGRVEIRVSSGISSSVEPLSRAVTDGMINSALTADLDVAFARTDATNAAATTYGAYETNALAGSVSSSTNELSFAPPAYYLANGYKTKLIGWYPRSSGVTFTATADGGTVAFGDINGKTDIMVTTLKVGDKNTKISAFGFSHLLTQICVKAYAVDADTKTLWGAIKSVKITDKVQTCTLTLPVNTSADDSKATPAFGTPSGDLTLIKVNPADDAIITWPIDLGTSASVTTTGYAMFAPVAAGGSIELQIDLANGGPQKKTIQASATDGFKEGYSYDITLKFTSAGITPTVSIVDWKTGDPITDVEI